jgi:hypothetical protein
MGKYSPCGGGDEYPYRIPACRKRRLKGKPGANGYSWATLSPGGINTEALSSRLGGVKVLQGP